MLEENEKELAKLDRLLDKTEIEIKKKRDEKGFLSAENFLENMQKTMEIYTVVAEEIASSLYIMGLSKHMTLVKKLARGVQQQTTSILKFSLKYYDRRSIELEKYAEKEKQMAKNNVYGNLTSLHNLNVNQNINPTSPPTNMLLPSPMASANSNGMPQLIPNMHVQENYMFSPVQSPLMQKGNLQTRTGIIPGHQTGSQPNLNTHLNNSKEKGAGTMIYLPGQNGQMYQTGQQHLVGQLQIPDMTAYSIFKEPESEMSIFTSTERARRKRKNEEIDEEEEEEWKLYQEEYEQNQKDIDELLRQKKQLEGVTSAGTAAQLKQVLRQMEATKRKVKGLTEGEGDSDIEELDMDIMKGQMLGAFDRAQKKTAKKVIKYVDTKEKIHRTGEHREALKKVDAETMPDPKMLEELKKIYRKDLEQTLFEKMQEIKDFYMQVAKLEDQLEETQKKYMAVASEHSRCGGDKHELNQKIEKYIELVEELKDEKKAMQNLLNEKNQDILKLRGVPFKKQSTFKESDDKLLEELNQYKELVKKLQGSQETPTIEENLEEQQQFDEPENSPRTFNSNHTRNTSLHSRNLSHHSDRIDENNGTPRKSRLNPENLKPVDPKVFKSQKKNSVPSVNKQGEEQITQNTADQHDGTEHMIPEHHHNGNRDSNETPYDDEEHREIVNDLPTHKSRSKNNSVSKTHHTASSASKLNNPTEDMQNGPESSSGDSLQVKKTQDKKNVSSKSQTQKEKDIKKELSPSKDLKKETSPSKEIVKGSKTEKSEDPSFKPKDPSSNTSNTNNSTSPSSNVSNVINNKSPKSELKASQKISDKSKQSEDKLKSAEKSVPSDNKSKQQQKGEGQSQTNKENPQKTGGSNSTPNKSNGGTNNKESQQKVNLSLPNSSQATPLTSPSNKGNNKKEEYDSNTITSNEKQANSRNNKTLEPIKHIPISDMDSDLESPAISHYNSPKGSEYKEIKDMRSKGCQHGVDDVEDHSFSPIIMYPSSNKSKEEFTIKSQSRGKQPTPVKKYNTITEEAEEESKVEEIKLMNGDKLSSKTMLEKKSAKKSNIDVRAIAEVHDDHDDSPIKSSKKFPSSQEKTPTSLRQKMRYQTETDDDAVLNLKSDAKSRSSNRTGLGIKTEVDESDDLFRIYGPQSTKAMSQTGSSFAHPISTRNKTTRSEVNIFKSVRNELSSMSSLADDDYDSRRMYALSQSSYDHPMKVNKKMKQRIQERIRKEENGEGPKPDSIADANRKSMYKAMLYKAQLDPKVLGMFKKGQETKNDDEYVVDYETFDGIVKNFQDAHFDRCGPNCSHLQRFYSRIGYYPGHLHRRIMELKKMDVSAMPDKQRIRQRLPMIPKRKPKLIV